jgi:hypothetical protein
MSHHIPLKRLHRRMVRASLCTAAATALVATAFTTVASASVSPMLSCTGDYFASGHIAGVDWLRVHSSPGVDAPAVGQLKAGTAVCYNPFGSQQKDGYAWNKGYGYNGSTKVTGWMVSNYLGA